jgi:hypothetical protein
LKLLECGGCRGETSDCDKPEPSLNAVLIQPEYFPDSSPDLVSGNRISEALCGNDPDSGCRLDFSRQYRQYEMLSGPGFTRRLDQPEL